MSDHKTFCAFGAYAVDVSHPPDTIVMVLANAADLGHGIDRSKLVPLNLDLRLDGKIGDQKVSFDEAILDTLGLFHDGNQKSPMVTVPPGGIDILTMGPAFPGQHVGGIYIERSKFFFPMDANKLSIRKLIELDRKEPNRKEPNPKEPDSKVQKWPHLDMHPYEVMSSASRIDNSTRRYHGFHAKVKESNGSIKVLEVREQSGAIITIIPRIDLDDRTQCDDPALLSSEIQDPDHPEKTEIALNAQSKQDAEGAIFLSLELCVQNFLSGPKEPPGAGGDELTRDHRHGSFPTRIMAVLNQQHTELSATDRATGNSTPPCMT